MIDGWGTIGFREPKCGTFDAVEPRGLQSVVVLIPIFNDWAALELVLRGLDRVAGEYASMTVVIVDDASTSEPHAGFCADPFQPLTSVVRVRLRRNLGHQRAISVGLVYVYETYPDAVTVIMDGDGEDRPEDIPILLAKFNAEKGRKIIFAERARRTEGFWFKLFYVFYKALHRVLTGIAVRVGNFSVVPNSCLSSLVVISEVWNHYAAAVFNARLPYDTIPVPRGRRLEGKSRMNFVSLVTHGLSAISVYSDKVGVRLLVISSGTITLLIVAVAVMFLAHLPAAIYVSGLLIVLLALAMAMGFVFILFTLKGRSGAVFLPIRDCPYFVAGVTRLHPANSTSG
jgi:glycosyltransferase involved in cell wall biosynthesis